MITSVAEHEPGRRPTSHAPARKRIAQSCDSRVVSDIASPLISGLLALSGVGVGAWATMAVRRAATMADRERYIAESRAAHRAELKTAVLNYLEHAQQLQGELDVRERGQSPEDLKRLIEQLWLAEKGVEIICSDALRDRLVAHARGLHEVVRDAADYPDWWAHCADLQYALIAQIKLELEPHHDF